QRDSLRVAVLAVDPSRRKSGGALLGDRLRMNSIDTDRVYMRSLATRGAGSEVPIALAVILDACRAARFDLILVETPGVGQGDSGIVSLVDRSVYVMTPEFGAPTQLEKIDMLDFADAVAINKFDRRGAPDALREVRRQLARAPERRGRPHDQLPVFGTVASHFNDDGVTALYEYLRDRLAEDGLTVGPGALPQVLSRTSSAPVALLPPTRSHYLAEVVQVVREYQARTAAGVSAARRRQQVAATSALLVERGASSTEVDELAAVLDGALDSESRHLLEEWPALAAKYRGDDGGRRSLAGTLVPRVSLPQFGDDGDLLRFLRNEHLPGHFPYTAGVFPFRRAGEGPTRMFAGEGGPLRTNRRFHLLAEGQPATRLSTAFDSVTLYGCDPAERPDIYGKIGNAGVSVATLDDMQALYHGFDLSSASTSVSMTINGPAPIILAMFFNVAIDQAVQRAHEQAGRAPTDDELMEIRAATLRQVRGTVQADILKEDQGQNTCIFSTEFALRTMADTQEWFVAQGVKNFYSVSISGYHIAEAGANPITQLAFTLANGFTYVEAYLARGMAVDTFAPNLSFFFSNGMDPEYTVIGRVARRIWAIAMRDRYGADARSQRLKYHVQTSGRSLHAQEMAFNDIRTTLQALCAIYDNANSLHTNAYDEAVTTPTEESVRRALAVQMIITREWGLAFNENMLQGSFIVEELTDLVEEAVLGEMERLNERGGVLGAMETGYQRGRVQDDSLRYELAKHDGSLPIVGVNTFVSQVEKEAPVPLPLARSTEEEKQGQLRRLAEFHRRHAGEAPGALAELQRVALSGENVFAALMSTARVASLGQITDALYAVGGRYRRAV
ncbi:MAG TPA: methylmalonyl-CoA mutase family protein, partial [Acidimicrobiales bacterium]|nr:methylmalonyl-CoA mutase family protein [Acidimicrobiales bacterium]